MTTLPRFGLHFRGLGAALPDRVVTNDDLQAGMDTSDEWIRERTGISARRLGSTTSQLAVAAGAAALRQAGIDPTDPTSDRIDQVVLATTTPDYEMPGTAPTVAHQLGLDCGAFDVQAVCSGWVYGLVTAHGLLAQGLDRVLLIGADTMESITEYTERGTGILFGNGAGAAVLERTDTPSAGQLLGWDLGADGRHTHILFTEHGKSMQMDGREVFRQAVQVMQRSTLAALERAGMSIEDVDYVFPHQANVRIVEAAWKRLGFSLDRTGLVLDQTGNTSSASIPLALVDAVQQGRVTDGDVVLFLGFGAGMTWGANLVRWHGPSDAVGTERVEVSSGDGTLPVLDARPMSSKPDDPSPT